MKATLRSMVLAFIAMGFVNTTAHAQNTDDHRSVNPGNWTAASTWQRFDGSTWVAAATAPSNASGVITVRSPHSVTFDVPGGYVDQLVVENGATLSVTNVSMTVLDGTGTDMAVDGTFQISPGATFHPVAGSTVTTAGAVIIGGTANNEGTWTMLGGTMTSGGGANAFQNYAGGVVDLNNWSDNLASWSSLNVTNQGTFNKNIAAQFGFSSVQFTNYGVFNVPSGSFMCSNGSFDNNGTLTFGGSSTVLKVWGPFNNNTGASLTGLQEMEVHGVATIGAGSTCDPLPLVGIASGSLTAQLPLTITTLNLSGGGIGGTATVTVQGGGQFNWSGGYISGGAVLDAAAGCTAQTTSTVYLGGTVNNHGYWSMQGGTMTLGGGANAFNNMSGAIMSLNAWSDTVATWSSLHVMNAGTINKGNGSTQFGMVSVDFNNVTGSTLNIPSGTLSAQNGSFAIDGVATIGAGARVTGNATILCTGATLINNGNIATSSQLSFQGTAAQALDGTGHVRNLTMNCTGGLNISGDQTLDSVLTLTAGNINVGLGNFTLARPGGSSLIGGSASSYIVVQNQGGLRRKVNGEAHLFPIGFGPSYRPITVSDLTGPDELFTARLLNNVNDLYSSPGVEVGAPLMDHHVVRTWLLTEGTNGGNTASLTFQWNASEEQSNFDRTDCAIIGFEGSGWNAGPFAAASGSDPYTQSAPDVSLFREFVVGDGLSTLIVGINEHALRLGLRAYPVPATDRITIQSEGATIDSFELRDAIGRIARAEVVGSAQFDLMRGSLRAGMYHLTVHAGTSTATLRVILE